ncbi:hypothetical protein F5X68DRAFT_39973 [Plectosphaerella plurivora]|uniref:NADH:flavin oxidoreductase/NADH oxidase N-terminal domain-containing protein n=1 Tax=Plectosphaerella plurivora TaxID=936078 RepID=A0A9P8V618_9PEZI|nr:hypothetical protein F5X68DRAFT_39973 [Plectosphaerella plurivora]
MTDTPTSQSRLFEPITVGRVQLGHRMALAPLTRFRCTESTHIPLPSVKTYYLQRCSTPGTLLIAEATQISPRHCLAPNMPGIWSEEQIEAWKPITEAIHAKGCFIYCQIMAPGRAGNKEGFPLYSASTVPMPGREDGPTPVEMTEEDIKTCIAEFAQAAKNAMAAGFDGIELHGANGYLIDQFTQDVTNQRTDAWGGSVENRSRFATEVTRAVAEAVGPENVGVRLSPWNTWQGMKMAGDGCLHQFSHLIREIKTINPAYLHLVESRVINNEDTEYGESLDFAFDIWKGQSPILVAGGFNAERARQAADVEYKAHDIIVVFGRYFLSTPDLVYRIRKGIPLNPYDRKTFYTPVQDEGYIDYAFSAEYLQEAAGAA